MRASGAHSRGASVIVVLAYLACALLVVPLLSVPITMLAAPAVAAFKLRDGALRLCGVVIGLVAGVFAVAICLWALRDLVGHSGRWYTAALLLAPMWLNDLNRAQGAGNKGFEQGHAEGMFLAAIASLFFR